MKSTFFILSIAVLFFNCKQTPEHTIRHKATTSQVEKPNIIVILLDDAGYADFGFMGSQDLETPNIDTLAQSGVILTDAHVSATVCAPSRAGLMTGKYQQRFGFEANDTGDKESGDIGLLDGLVLPNRTRFWF